MKPADTLLVVVDGLARCIGPADYLAVRSALADLIGIYDRVTGAAGHGEGWTAADVLRMAEIRVLIHPDVVIVNPDGDSRPPKAPGGAKWRGKPTKSKKARKTRQNGS